MYKIRSTFQKRLTLLMMLLAVIIVLNPVALRADACLDAFGNCIADLSAYAMNPLHFMVCINGIVFCYAYLNP